MRDYQTIHLDTN